MESLLLNSCCGVCVVLVVEYLLRSLCCGIFVVASSLLNSCCGVCVVFVCHIRGGLFVVESLLWNLC